MKKIKTALFILLVAQLFTSCNDKCAGVVCTNGNQCVDGTCVIPPVVNTDPPVVNSLGIYNITNESAEAYGNLISTASTSDIERGFCWNTSPGPTTANSNISNVGTTGSYHFDLTGLGANTTYYVRAFATNQNGTAYGDELSFTTLASPPGTVLDVDGNLYHVIYGAGHAWLAENLKVTRYRNGDPIPTGLSNTAWGATSSGAYSNYGNLAGNGTTYGRLYNWAAVQDSRGLCPSGWRPPTLTEIEDMVEDYLGGWYYAGKIKATGTTHWASPNGGAENTYGFGVLPTGCRYTSGTYTYKTTHSFWWTSSSASGTEAYSFSISNGSGQVWTFYEPVQYGLACRCIQE